MLVKGGWLRWDRFSKDNPPYEPFMVQLICFIIMRTAHHAGIRPIIHCALACVAPHPEPLSGKLAWWISSLAQQKLFRTIACCNRSCDEQTLARLVCILITFPIKSWHSRTFFFLFSVAAWSQFSPNPASITTLASDRSVWRWHMLPFGRGANHSRS